MPAKTFASFGTIARSNATAKAPTLYVPAGRPRRGSHGTLSEDQVREIRAEPAVRNVSKKLAKKYNVSEYVIKAVREGTTYAWVI